MLKLVNTSVKYKDRYVLSNLNYEFKEGNIYVLLGENGSGKSTLLKAIARIINYQGEIINQNLTGFLPDKMEFPFLASSYSYLKDIANMNDRIVDLESLITGFDLQNKIIGSLSKGNLQKVGLIQFFLLDAKVYLLDEPFDGLDTQAKSFLKKQILSKKESNDIVILSLHDKKIFTSQEVKYLEIKGGNIYEKKDKKSKTVENIL